VRYLSLQITLTITHFIELNMDIGKILTIALSIGAIIVEEVDWDE